MSMKYWWNHEYGVNTKALGKKSVPVPLGAQQTPHGLGSSPGSVQRSQSQTASARHGPVNVGVTLVR
jgi:hypothetical protein